MAIILVMGFHFRVSLFEVGYLGVDIFFVLSGFLITGNILGEIKKERFNLRNFWGKRIRRLGPANWVLLLGVLIWS
jgi:peptidoglycan/LPS O-acetylase OafA/YrhL